jgi:hypothetical protein
LFYLFPHSRRKNSISKTSSSAGRSSEGEVLKSGYSNENEGNGLKKPQNHHFLKYFF